MRKLKLHRSDPVTGAYWAPVSKSVLEVHNTFHIEKTPEFDIIGKFLCR